MVKENTLLDKIYLETFRTGGIATDKFLDRPYNGREFLNTVTVLVVDSEDENKRVILTEDAMEYLGLNMDDLFHDTRLKMQEELTPVIYTVDEEYMRTSEKIDFIENIGNLRLEFGTPYCVAFPEGNRSRCMPYLMHRLVKKIDDASWSDMLIIPQADRFYFILCDESICDDLLRYTSALRILNYNRFKNLCSSYCYYYHHDTKEFEVLDEE